MSSAIRSLLFATIIPACGGGAPLADPDAATAPDLALPDLAELPDLGEALRDPKVHPDLPSVFYNGGRLLKQVQVITATWEGDALAQPRADFAAWYVNSSTYDILAEYGISHGSAVGPFFLKGPPPASLDESQVGPLIRDNIQNGTLPPPGRDALYVIYTPAGVATTLQGSRGCEEFGGYHSRAATGMQSPQTMAFAIIPACVQGGGEFDSDTSVATHEIGEAVTDPEGGGYYNPSMPLSEIGDLCSGLDAVITGGLADAGTHDYAVQRLYSAQTAAKGDSDPCLPVPGGGYSWFDAAMDPDEVDVTLDQSGLGTATFQIEPFAYGAVGKITWQVYSYRGGVILTPSQGYGFAGSSQLVTVRVKPPAVGTFPITVVAHAKGWMNVWYGTVVAQ